MPTPAADIANLYNVIGAREASRLDEHPIEFLTTLRAIREALPPAPRRIADVGGGPGKYAFALADEGHLVDLVDLSPGLVAIAQATQDKRRVDGCGSKALLRSLAVGNALDTAILQDGAYDAVLLLGPLYHLVEEAERASAVANAARLAKPGGVLFVTFVSIAAHLRDVACKEPTRLVSERAFYDKYLHDGRYEKFKPGRGQFHSFHTQAGDIRSFFRSHFDDTLELVQLQSQEGILGGSLDATLSTSEPHVVQAWADLMYEQYSTAEEYLGCADHLLAILRKK